MNYTIEIYSEFKPNNVLFRYELYEASDSTSDGEWMSYIQVDIDLLITNYSNHILNIIMSTNFRTKFIEGMEMLKSYVDSVETNCYDNIQYEVNILTSRIGSTLNDMNLECRVIETKRSLW